MTVARRGFALLLAAGLAAGCGREESSQVPAAQPGVVTGSVSKGPLRGATVNFYAVDAGGNLSGSELVSPVTTDSSGNFSVSGLPSSIPVLVVTNSGSYVDESDPETNPSLKRTIAFGVEDTLEAVLPPGQATLAITPYSMALLKKARIQAAGGNFANVYAAVRTQATSAFGFDPITTIPADPITGAGGSRQYALLLGAAALTINKIATTGTPEHLPGYADVIAFVDDLSDGRLDAASLSDMVRRFRNNNIGVYGGTQPPVVDEATLSQPAPVANVAPTITGQARALSTDEDVSLTLTLGDLTVDDPDDAYPGGFTLIVLTGANYTVSGATVTPAANFNGTLSVPVRVNDGDSDSNTFNVSITVLAVADPPVLDVNAGLTVDQGATALITTSELSASDIDTADSGIVFDVTAAPASGVLEVMGIGPAASFTQSDLALGLVSYTHDGSPTSTDSFQFTLRDASNFSADCPSVSPCTFAITINPVAAQPALLVFLTGDGELKLLDPLDPVNPQLLDSGVAPGAGEGDRFRTLFGATISGGIATDIRAARLVYIKDDGTNKKVWKVNLDRGQLHTPVQVSGILNACGLNGSAEDIANPDNSVLRVDTAGTDGICNTSDDFTTGEAFLVKANAPDTAPGFAIGLGQCCGTASIMDSTGALIDVLTTEGDGTTNFVLRRRNASTFAVVGPDPIATLVVNGAGPTFGRMERGLGDLAIYFRARRDVDSTFMLHRFNVADNTVDPLYDYNVATSDSFSDSFDNATYDGTNVYFVDGTSLLSVPHAAIGLDEHAVLDSRSDPVSHIDQTTDRIVFEAHGTAGGVFSVPKVGGTVATLALDDATTPTFTFLNTVDRDRVYLSIQSFPSALPAEFTARVVNADGTSPSNTADAQWAGENGDTNCDFANDCDTTFQALAILLRKNAGGSSADLETVDPLTGTATGTSLGSIPSAASVFGFGFGRFAQLTVFTATEDQDIWLADIQTADSVQPVSQVAGTDQWILFGDGDGGGSQQPLDSDGDGLTDDEELSLGTDPFNPDTDSDGLTDCQESKHRNRTQCEDPGFTGPFDGGYGTDPTNSDTDGDGIPDGAEIFSVETDPLNPDTDGDDIGDGLEVTYGSLPGVDDSAKIYVRTSSEGGSDANPGSSWTGAVATHSGVDTALANLGASATNPTYVLYEGLGEGSGARSSFFGNMTAGFSNVVYIGSLGPGISTPQNWTGGPPAPGSELGTVFDASTDGGVAAVTATNVKFDSIEFFNGGIGGLLVNSGSSVSGRRLSVFFNADTNGGGISVIAATPTSLDLVNSTVSGNTATGSSSGGLGGGIYNEGSLTLDNVEVSSNTAARVDATNFGFGGGLFTASGSDAFITNSVLKSNTADGAGGGIFVATGGAQSAGDVFIHQTTIDNNFALRPNVGDDGGNGGGICASGPFTVTDSVISHNLAEASSAQGGFAEGGGGINAGFGLVLSNSKLFGNEASQGAGGGLQVGSAAGATTDIDNTAFADNRALAGPGGGANLLDVPNALVRNSQFLSNASSRPGAGLHIHAAGPVTVFNNLVVGNASTDSDADGAGMEIEHVTASALSVNSNTVAYNQVVGNALTGVGAGVSVSPSTSTFDFRNNIIWFNNNATLAAEAGDNLFLDSGGGFNASGNNADESPFSGNAGSMPLDPLFVEGFYLDPVAPSTSIDAGDNTFAVVYGAGSGFTTDPAGPEDAGQVDIGFHHAAASPGAAAGVSAFASPSTAGCPSATVILSPELASGNSLGPGHLVVAGTLTGPGGSLSGITTLQPMGAGSVLAVDEGNGGYRVGLSGSSSGNYDLDVFVDGQGPFTASFSCL